MANQAEKQLNFWRITCLVMKIKKVGNNQVTGKKLIVSLFHTTRHFKVSSVLRVQGVIIIIRQYSRQHVLHQER
jgi:hypothetical protein